MAFPPGWLGECGCGRRIGIPLKNKHKGNSPIVIALLKATRLKGSKGNSEKALSLDTSSLNPGISVVLWFRNERKLSWETRKVIQGRKLKDKHNTTKVAQTINEKRCKLKVQVHALYYCYEAEYGSAHFLSYVNQSG